MSPWRTLSPSSTYDRPTRLQQRACATASATVDLPEPDSPVNHTVAPCSPAADQRASRPTVASCQKTGHAAAQAEVRSMPAAAVWFVASSIRTKLPVTRLRR